MQFKPGLTVLILSSNSKCKPEKVEEIIKRTPELSLLKGACIIIDISKGEKIIV